MGDKTGISWTTSTWNPVTGCDRVSPGCDHCYALTLAKRLKAMGNPKYQADGDPRTSGPGFGVTVHPAALEIPLRWRDPRMVFVNSMGDLFHDKVPDEFIARVFAIMAHTPRHTYQVLTKRHARMRSLLSSAGWQHQLHVAATNQHTGSVQARLAEGLPVSYGWPLPNVWLGISAEDQHWADIRVPALLGTPAAVRFVSAEPLLGPVDLKPGRWIPPLGGGPKVNLARPWETPGPSLDWVIAGGESGPGHRPMDPAWLTSLAVQCDETGTAFWCKQASGPRSGFQGTIPDAVWAIRQFPLAVSA